MSKRIKTTEAEATEILNANGDRCRIGADWSVQAWSFGCDVFVADDERDDAYGPTFSVLVRDGSEDEDGNDLIVAIAEGLGAMEAVSEAAELAVSRAREQGR